MEESKNTTLEVKLEDGNIKTPEVKEDCQVGVIESIIHVKIQNVILLN